MSPGTRFPGTDQLRRLGIIEPEAFTPRGGAMQSVIVVDDLSIDISQEARTARAILVHDAGPSPGLNAMMELVSRSDGGLIIEHLLLLEPVQTPTSLHSHVGIDSTALLLLHEDITHLNIGGVATKSISAGEDTALLHGGLSLPWRNEFSPTVRIFVKSREVFWLRLTPANTRMVVEVQWRELPEVIQT